MSSSGPVAEDRSIPAPALEPSRSVTAADDFLFEFGVQFRYAPTEVVATLQGEVDALSSPACAAVLNAGVREGRHVVLDLEAVTFFSAAGLQLVAGLARRLHAVGGAVEVRSASVLTRKLFDITDVRSLVTMTDGIVEDLSPDAEQTVGANGSDQLARDLADALLPFTHEALVDATMAMLTTIAHQLVRDVVAASVTMQRRDRLITVAASDPIAVDLDETQYAAGVGPCVQAATEGRATLAHRTADAHAWEPIREPAEHAGIHGVLSTPIGGPSMPLAALNLYSATGEFAASDVELISLLTHEAAAVVSVPSSGRFRLVDRMRAALATRDVIALAQGRIMEREHVAAEEAYTRLREASIAADTPLGRYAETVGSPLSPDPDAS